MGSIEEAGDCSVGDAAWGQHRGSGANTRSERKQVFSWRRAYQRGELNEPSGALIPVRVSGATESSGPVDPMTASNRGSIHIEFPGRALISVERGADPSLLRSILESLRK